MQTYKMKQPLMNEKSNNITEFIKIPIRIDS